MSSPECGSGAKAAVALGVQRRVEQHSALLRPEVPFIDLDIRREVTPPAACASEDVTKLDVVGVQEVRVIKRACWHRANAGIASSRKPRFEPQRGQK